MTKRTYPYTAWALKPSFKPAEVTIKEHYSWSGGDWDMAESGKLYSMSDLFQTKEAAIAEGWKRLRVQEAKVQKMVDSIEKKKAALTKAI